MKNLSHLADSLKKAIKDKTGQRVNIPECEVILESLIDDLESFLASGQHVRLGKAGIFKLEITKEMKVSGNLPNQKGKMFNKPKQVRVYFSPTSEFQDKLNQNLNKF